jgi:adenosylhomocysteine nucleosidase
MQTPIGLVAAMPEEIGPLLKMVDGVTRESVGGFPLYRFTYGAENICLVESGMGPQRAAAATTALIAAAAPGLIINFGFAGGVTNGLATGDIAVASGAADCSTSGVTSLPGISERHRERAIALLNGRRADGGYRSVLATFLTAGQIQNKRELAARLPGGSGEYLLDMETTAVVRTAVAAGIPVLAVRAISDGANEELGFSIDEFTDETMTVRIGKVLKTVARKPWIIPQLIRLAGNVRLAGAHLADAVVTVLKGEFP